MQKILVLTNSINGLYSFRRELVERLIKDNYEVTISAPEGTKSSYFDNMGCKLIYTSINRRGINPAADFKLFYYYFKIIRKVKPNVVLTYTIKPNVYGGLVCRLLKVPYIANITGLGTSIENKGALRTISLFLYKVGLKKAHAVFFQNRSNKEYFIKKKIVDENISREIPGSGVNINYHIFEEYPTNDEIIKFLFIGRIMKAKGIDELLEAAQMIKKIYPKTEFHFVGDKEENFDVKLNNLTSKGIIHYHGRQENVHYFIKNCHATINPSYHEGMSNVLLESASTGRPVLASKISGCKETFDEGISGFGFEVRNVDSLVGTIIKFIELPYDDKKKMGIAGRKKMEKEFDRRLVVEAYLKEIGLAGRKCEI
jgi:glycosyltransferase involved in cell wall biosynthesis